ncbi:MAG: bifunctional 4-hydroxy-2-oxoglutarate aldolase/2-dehydro-3-deoxy-phosphogluconate aldolase [Intestinimonas sp.]
MHPILNRIRLTGIIPVVKLEDAGDAVPLARALVSGGLPAAEITFRTSVASEAIRRMTFELPEMLIGAGTVLTCEQVTQAVNAGAQFIVSPGTNPRVVHRCQELGVPVLPGVVTPTEIEAALELGLDVLKFFPAEPSGGLPMIESLAAPYPGVRFMPTGGINASNAGTLSCQPKSAGLRRELDGQGHPDPRGTL